MALESPRMIPAGEFKTRCLSLMDTVQDTGEEIIITKHGNPVARLAPCLPEREYPILRGLCKGEIKVYGDIVSPLPLDEEWMVEWAAQWKEWLTPPDDADDPSASEE